MNSSQIRIMLAALFISTALLAQPQEGGPHGKGGPAKMMDTNKDGTISRAEWDAFHAGMFQKMDKNSDGSLSEDEMKSMHPPGGKGEKPKK